MKDDFEIDTSILFDEWKDIVKEFVDNKTLKKKSKTVDTIPCIYFL